jgi:hypothetical protein
MGCTMYNVLRGIVSFAFLNPWDSGLNARPSDAKIQILTFEIKFAKKQKSNRYISFKKTADLQSFLPKVGVLRDSHNLFFNTV